MKASEKTTGLLGKIKNHPIITMVASAATGIVMIAGYIGAYDTIMDKVNEWFFGGGQTAKIAAINDSVTITEDQTIQIDVLENDINLTDKASLSINLDDTGTRGRVRVLKNKIIEYLPEKDDAGNDTFGYTIITGDGEAASARVEVIIEEVNDPPATSMMAVTASYPQESVLAVDVLGNSFDPDGEQLRLVSYGVASREAQPELVVKLLDQWKSVMSINGVKVNIDSETIKALNGYLLLPIGRWVKEEIDVGKRNSFVQVVNYRLEDERGLGQDFSFNVEVLYPQVSALGLECERGGDGGPDKVEMELTLNGESVTKFKYELDKMNSFGFSGFSRKLTAIDFQEKIEIQATWKSVESYADFSCKTKLFVKGFGLIDHGEVDLGFARRHYKDKWNVINSKAMFWSDTQRIEAIGHLVGMN